MNDNDIIKEEIFPAAADDETENKPVVESETATEAPSDEAETATDEEAAQIEETDEIADEAPMLTEKTRIDAVCDPMFSTFVKGKDQPLDALIADFIKMKSLGAGEPKLSAHALATPCGSAASPDYALSERQRKIAHSAGMSYREYYNFLKTMK